MKQTPDEAGRASATDHLVDAAATRPLEDFVQLYRQWLIAHHELPGSQPERVEKTHLLLYAAAAAGTLGEAVALLVRFRRITWGDRGFLQRSAKAGLTALVFTQPFRADVAGLVSDLWSLAFQLAELEFLVGGALEGVAGQVRQPAGLPAPAAAVLFDRPVAYAAPDLALLIPTRHLARPVVAQAAQVPDFLRRLVPTTVGADRAPPLLAPVVAGMLRAEALHGAAAPPGLEAVAARLGASPATLRRRLVAEETSFRALKDQAFDDLARLWLAQGLPVERVAARLGYSDAFAFRRAFGRRHGIPPSAYRRAAGSAGQHAAAVVEDDDAARRDAQPE